VERFQHEAVAANGDDDVGLRQARIAVAVDQRAARLLRLRRARGDKLIEPS